MGRCMHFQNVQQKIILKAFKNIIFQKFENLTTDQNNNNQRIKTNEWWKIQQCS